MFALLANGPAPVPQSTSPAEEWAIWGAAMSAAAVLSGFALLNRNRPSRDAPVCVAMLLAFALGIGATGFAMHRSHIRQMEQNRLERERRDRENGGPPEFHPPY